VSADADRFRSSSSSELGGVSDKAVRDAGTIPVTAI